ncbi:MAG: tyrosine--tRNA ligase [Actinobacteria bacterium]|nr:tyrosine--tRNA ligase [Actinomycetota bacterium]MBU4240363.1 tyrosine--tRNA ligase [Actinomycetota bacterium]MBU4489960.1 tyrosine--tRNA ligase [Actinomycetota bacterium]MCG2796314.1 tyrosine--tRNA ligase [Actinomycetes bacterium]
MSVEERVREQMELISSGTVEVIPEGEMRRKVARSLETGRPLVVKLGVDPTRPDLHIGHSVPLTKLRHFQQLGHQVVLIIGDFTALIGDPSMQDATRPVLTEEEVEKNARTYIEQAERVIDTKCARVVRNSQWLSPLDFKDVLEIASRFTVARILERDDFSRRYREGKPVGLHEFLYPVMQAYDSVVIEADIEIGGTDQKFNLLAGRNLQRSMGKEPQCIIILPLLEGTNGVRKMSKSLENDVGLTDPAGEMFGKLMSIPDDIIWDYFRLVTRVGSAAIEQLKGRVENGEVNPRDAKERLAVEVVGIYHGPKEAEEAADEFRRVFSMGELPGRIPPVEVPRSRFRAAGIWVVDLVVSLGLASSNGEARRLIAGGGIAIEGEKVEDADLELTPEQVDGKVVRKGKKTFVRVELV